MPSQCILPWRPQQWQLTVPLLLAALAAPRFAVADIAPPLPPPLETVLPDPPYVVAIGLTLSVVFVLFGSRLVSKGKLSRRLLNIVLFLVGAATAITAVYSKKIRVDYRSKVERARDAYEGPVREPMDDLDVPDPTGGDLGKSPPTVDPPSGPAEAPPSIDPPAIDPPAIDAPAADPSANDGPGPTSSEEPTD